MKHLRRLVLALVLLLSVVAVYAGGIKDAKDLVAFVTLANKGEDFSQFRNEAGVVCLEADIDMAKVKKLPAIKSFGGTFDGQGHSLKNWKAQQGLFHEILEGGKVCNLRIDASCSMKAQNKDAEEYFLGWIAGINYGQIQDCENYAPISHKSSYTEHDLYVGGLVGSNRYVVYRCKNYGTITSICSASAPNKELIRLGGIAGGVYKKFISCAVFARCENYGDVIYKGDMPNDRVGGVVGEHFGASIKFCLNRGNVSSTSSISEGGKAGMSHVAGISGWGNGHILCTDNFGDVKTSGTHRALAAGIVSVAHGRFILGDCTNYGKVEVTNDTNSVVGGVVATSGRGVNVVNCHNRGYVRFAGTSVGEPSYIGGIIGHIYSPRKAKYNVYLRRCVNYGKVESLSGGNGYENHDKAIHTGGVVGGSFGVANHKVRICDCANKGEVKAATGRKGNIAGYIVETEVTGGFFDNNYALSAEPKTDGSNIFGRVTNNLGEAVVGCVVSDGEQCVATDNDGYYAMKSDLGNTRFVTISIPDGYKIPHRKSIVQNFRRVPRHEKAVEANFTLEKRTEPTDKYTVIMIGDPQMRGLNAENSGERYRDEVLPDIEAFKKTREGEFFAITLGDLVYNWMAGYSDYLDINKDLSFPAFNIIGNHDYDQINILETELGTPFYEEYISPTYYSFTIGKIHYVMVNSIIYDRPDHKASYRGGLQDKQMKWLEEDLKYIPKDYTIYINGHAQLFKKKTGSKLWTHGIPLSNYPRYSELLKQYSKVYSWSGHYHTNYCYSYAGKEAEFPGFSNITCISVARAIGDLRSNLKLMSDGEENGYMVVEVDGNDVKWWYKVLGKDRNYQMRPYTPTRTGDGYLKVNVWNYTKGAWSAVEWWENGVKVGEFEKHKEPDPDYAILYADYIARHPKSKYGKPHPKSDYMFRIKPSEGVRSGEIRVTDNFGVTYTQKVEW